MRPWLSTTKKEPLTEENGEKFGFLDHSEEQVPVDVLDGVLFHLVQDPSQQFALFARISCKKKAQT